MSSHRVRACLITNPRSGLGGIDLSPVLPILEANGWDVTVQHKLEGGMATDLARQAARDGYHVVVACGGDGTLNEIVDGLVGTGVAVGALPGGTVNEWTRELGISQRLTTAAQQLVGSIRRIVDVGRLTINGTHDRHFLLMAGLGFDGAIMAKVSKPLKNRIGPLAVGLATLRALPSFDAVSVEIAMDAVRWEGRTGQIIIGNTRRYGGFTAFTPNAYVDDGMLDICVFTATSVSALVRQATPFMLRRQARPANVELFRTGQVTIHAPSAMPLQLDGGTVHTRIEATDEGATYACTLVAQGLTVLVPAMYSGYLFQHPVSAPVPRGAKGKRTYDTHNGKQTKAANRKGAKREMQVIVVGSGTITVARAHDGRVFSVVTGPETTARDLAGHKVSLDAFLALLHVGDLVHVKGSKDHDRGMIDARRLTLRSRADRDESEPQIHRP